MLTEWNAELELVIQLFQTQPLSIHPSHISTSHVQRTWLAALAVRKSISLPISLYQTQGGLWLGLLGSLAQPWTNHCCQANRVLRLAELESLGHLWSENQQPTVSHTEGKSQEPQRKGWLRDKPTHSHCGLRIFLFQLANFFWSPTMVSVTVLSVLHVLSPFSAQQPHEVWVVTVVPVCLERKLLTCPMTHSKKV